MTSKALATTTTPSCLNLFITAPIEPLWLCERFCFRPASKDLPQTGSQAIFLYSRVPT
jgi:hypothetical protein